MIYFLIALFIIVPITLGIYIAKYEDPRKDLGGFGGRK
jgi:hypothetical protein